MSRESAHPLDGNSLRLVNVYFTTTERSQKALADIGGAVFNGGFSTFLAFMLLITANSLVFEIFFKVSVGSD